MRIAGIIMNMKVVDRKKDGAKMCMFQIRDITDSIDAVCFPNTFERIASQLAETYIVYLKGNVEVEMDDEGNMTSRRFIVQDAEKLES